MYQTMLPPHMMLQIVGGEQTNGQCSPAQIHSNSHTDANNNINNTLQNNHMALYIPNISGQNRHRLMQRNTYIPEPSGIMGVEIPSIRRGGYGRQNGGYNNGINSSGNWQRRNNNNNNNSNNSNGNNCHIISSPRSNCRPNNNSGSMKKPTWNSNKHGKRNHNSNKDQLTSAKNEINNYNSDSGISSRSPTPSKQSPDSIQTESSDDHDSVSSSIEQEIKKLSELPQNTIQNVAVFSPPRYIQMVQSQYYYPQQTLNFYPNISLNTKSTHNEQCNQGKKRYTGKATTPMQKNLRSRKYPSSLVPSCDDYSKPFVLPDQFLIKSIFVHSSKPPDNLICHSPWDNLSKDIWKKFTTHQQTEDTYKKKIVLWERLFLHFKTVWPKYGLYLVGSTMNGLGSDSSDVDLCLLGKNTEYTQRNEALYELERIRFHLQRYEREVIERIELIPAKVPILKFHDRIRNLDVDLNYNNCVGVRNTHLLYCYSQIDWRVRPLVLVIKLWAQVHDINDAKSMTISSYSLVLMVIHFLQCGVNPPILPCLHSLYKDKFNSHLDINLINIHEELKLPPKSLEQINQQPLGELLHDFLKYYSFFDFKTYAISVRTARRLPIDECRFARSWKNDPNHWTYLCIEEPFDLTNTARSVYNLDEFLRIQSVFHWSYRTLREKRCLLNVFVKHFPRPKIYLPRP